MTTQRNPTAEEQAAIDTFHCRGDVEDYALALAAHLQTEALAAHLQAGGIAATALAGRCDSMDLKIAVRLPSGAVVAPKASLELGRKVAKQGGFD